MSKKVCRIFNELNQKLKLEKYYELSTILNKLNLKSFLYDFIELYYSMKNGKDFDYVYYNKKCYKFIYDYRKRNFTKKDQKTVSKKTNLLVTLGLIDKLNIYTPELSKLEVIKNALQKSRNQRKRSVNFFYIPNYTHKLLKSANEIAIILLRNKITLEKFTKSYLISIFGQEFANNVFIDKRVISNDYKQKLLDIENILIETLKEKKLIQVNEFKEFIITQYNNITSSKSMEKIVKLVIDNLVINKVIICRRLSKKEKELYNIDYADLHNYILKGEDYNAYK